MRSPNQKQTVHRPEGFSTRTGVPVLCGECSRRAVWRHRRTGRPPIYRCALCRRAQPFAPHTPPQQETR